MGSSVSVFQNVRRQRRQANAIDRRDQRKARRLGVLQSFVFAHESTFRKDFRMYLEQNMHVFNEFEKRARRLWNAGCRSYGARTIAEAIRFESDVSEVGPGWKINNLYVPDMARLFVFLNPACDGLFRFRCSKKRTADVQP